MTEFVPDDRIDFIVVHIVDEVVRDQDVAQTWEEAHLHALATFGRRRGRT